jgi:peroxiredoxin
MSHTGRARWVRAALVAVALVASPMACSQDQMTKEPDTNAEPARLDFALKDMAGKDVRLAEFKGRPLVINFWATWCGPCRAEIPGLVELVAKYQREQLTVLGISIDDTPEALQRFAAEHKINYPLLAGLGHDDLLETYDAVGAIPVTWFIRRDGTVYLKKMGTDSREWFEAQVKALF